MTPKLVVFTLFVPPVFHWSLKTELAKLTNPDQLAALKVDLIHVRPTADKKHAKSATTGKHWGGIVTNDDH